MPGMLVELKGLHSATKTLADGSTRKYYYAWKGGPRITAEWGTPAFAAEFARLKREKGEPEKDTVAALIATYRFRHLPALQPPQTTSLTIS